MKILISESQLKSIIEGEYMYHVGDIDMSKKIKPHGSENIIMMDGSRGTGHFGSGMYFSTYNCEGWGYKKDFTNKYGSEHEGNKHYLTQVANRLFRVNSELYQNLYRVDNAEQGYALHDTLKFINGQVSSIHATHDEINYNRTKQYPIIKHNMERLGLKVPPYKEFIGMLRNANTNKQEHQKGDVSDRRSFSTRIMEYNGYNGVNVSGVKELDNTTYGSVIYDLDKMSREFEPVGKNEVGSYCKVQNNLIVNKQEFIDTPEQNVMRLSTSGKELSPITISKIPAKYITFFFNRYPYFLSEVDLSFQPDEYKKVYFKTLIRKLRLDGMKPNRERIEKYLKPIIHHNLNIILDPRNLYEGYTLLYLVLSQDFYYDDETELIPILRRIKETGRKLSPEEQQKYDEIREENKDYESFNGVF